MVYQACRFREASLCNNVLFAFQPHAPQEGYEALINTMVPNALLRYSMKVPSLLQQHNLFALNSNTVIRAKVATVVKAM